MKIGFVVTYFYPFKDGTENNCLYLARELAKKHEVHIFTSDRREGVVVENKEEEFQGLHIHRCRTIFRYRYYMVFDIDFIPKIMKYKFDILHVHSIGFLQQDIAVVLKKIFTNTKIVNTPHGPFLANENYSIPIKIARTIYKLIEYPINHFFYDASIDVNSTQKIWMVEYGFKENKIKFNPDGVPKDRLRKIENKEFIKKYNLKNKFVISSLGRLLPYKGFDQIIKALPSITKKHPNVLYLCMGDDRGDLKRLKSLVKENKVEKYILFLGEVSEDDKLKALDASEIFLFPSEPGTEAFGIVTLEAMLRKNAVVASNTEGSLFLIEKDNGFIFNYGNTEKLAEYVNLLIENEKLRKSMQETNYNKAKNYINENIAWDPLEKIYLEVLNKK
ncbi:glycosyltransferase family 4 protein [Candidatus Woesearchaeota archaeon]|nr:glycosyltransferase family 4 protein [Candidatus Woesearchaeota archaeon]